MENASKALLIAGAMLLAIILITLGLTMYSSIVDIQKEKQAKKEIEQVEAFNAQFEAFNKTLMYGADVITLYNKVEEHNKNSNEQIKLEISEEGLVEKIERFRNGAIKGEEAENFLKYMYKCTYIAHGKSGKINQIRIEPVQKQEE